MSSKQIKMHNAVITNTLNQRKSIESEIKMLQDGHQHDMEKRKYQHTLIKSEIKKLKDNKARYEIEFD